MGVLSENAGGEVQIKSCKVVVELSFTKKETIIPTFARKKKKDKGRPGARNGKKGKRGELNV